MPRSAQEISTVFILVLTGIVSTDAFAAVWYVDMENAGTEDGTSWTTAFRTIQPTIDAAFLAGGGEVWVAEGVYDEPRTSIVHPAPDDVNTGSVVLKGGVELYGGFIGIGPGGNETERTQRKWTTHVTTLEGSTARDGNPAYHVVVGAMSSTLDGFTITGGDAGGGGSSKTNILNAGGGMFNKSLFMALANCVFDENRAFSAGGGVFNLYASPSITECTFSENEAYADGGGVGGVHNETASPSFSKCLFVENAASGQFSVGAVRSTHGSSASFLDCSFISTLSSGNSKKLVSTLFGRVYPSVSL